MLPWTEDIILQHFDDLLDGQRRIDVEAGELAGARNSPLRRSPDARASR